jgi:hypothetical protein
LQTGQLENTRKIKRRIGYEKKDFDEYQRPKTETLLMIKWLQIVINVRNAEEIQLGKDIQDVGSNAVEKQKIPVDWSQLL